MASPSLAVNVLSVKLVIVQMSGKPAYSPSLVAVPLCTVQLAGKANN